MSNDGLSEKSKIGGILNVFRSIQTRLLALFRKGPEPIFLKNELLGEFSGNILESIAKLFPPDAASKIEKAPPLRATWKVFERITSEGTREFIYFVSPGTSIQVLEVVSSIYQEKHRIKGYPGFFDGTKDHLPSFLFNMYYHFYNGKREIVVGEESFMSWLPENVQVNASSA